MAAKYEKVLVVSMLYGEQTPFLLKLLTRKQGPPWRVNALWRANTISMFMQNKLNAIAMVVSMLYGEQTPFLLFF